MSASFNLRLSTVIAENLLFLVSACELNSSDILLLTSPVLIPTKSTSIIIGTDEFVLGGDIIVSVNDTMLKDRDTVVKVVQSMKVGDKITFSFLRDGLIQSTEVVLPERPSLPGDVRRFYGGANR